MKCDSCDKPATVHLIEIKGGQKIEKHLCESCAVDEGVAVKASTPHISDLLEKFMIKHGALEPTQQTVRCEGCGMTQEEFRKSGLLGCPHCYDAFEEALAPLLGRAHEGASQHVGKVPSRAGIDEIRQRRLMQLRRELAEAVDAEQYERAANLRDQLSRVEAEDD
ncbi:MAG: hypothetical protein GC159_00640 [Phycisphaera sp.]|nr:hypothetical protein [Phycisphaera sp.]